MFKFNKIGLLMLLVVFCLSTSQVFAISKVAKKYNFLEFSVGFSQPVGTFDKIGAGGYQINFINDSGRLFKLDAAEVYDASYHFGINYGQIQGNIAFNFGFNFTQVNHEDTFFVDDVIYWYDNSIGELTFRLYDLNVNLNYHFTDPTKMGLSPFVGAGLKTGFLNASIPGFESENEFTYSLGINFGADATIWQSSDKRSMIAISSINQFQFLQSSSRPKYLNIGGGIKYYFSL